MGGEASVEGLCFAIPISHAQGVINDLINYGYVTGKPMLGINTTVDIDEMLSQRLGFPVGVYIKALEEGGAAELAGMRVGDIIIAINDEPVTSADELRALRDKFKAGETITVTASRNGVDMNFDVTLQENVPTKHN
jgi:serine protease Do